MVRRLQTGKGRISDALKAAHQFVKQKRLISQGLRYAGYSQAAKHAAMLGYGKKKKRKRTIRGRGFFGKTIGSIGGGLLGGLLPF